MSLKEEIIKESKIFVRQNHGLLIDTDGHYTSPRISSEFMDCSMPMTFDQYSHCSLGCLYCFAYAFKSNNPSFNSKLRAVNYEEMILSLEGKAKTARGKAMYRNFYKKRFVLHWGGLGDPFCNFEKANGIGYEIIEALGSEAYPTLFSFKGSAIFRTRYRKLFEKYSDQSNFAFQVSIITGNDSLGKVVEIGVPIPSRRIDAIRMLSEMGYYTILRLRPYIIGISEHGIDELLDRSLDAGIKAISMEFFAMDARANPGMKKRYKWLGNLIGTKDIDQYFKTLSPSKRGGYMRLNRKVKETHVKTVYDFCMKNDLVFACSDPDFKELNTSGSCCGMPASFEGNKELENWTKNQLSYHIKEAKMRFDKTGKTYMFHFDRVFKPDEDTYLVDPAYMNDHIGVSGMSASERRVMTYLEFARNTWNNLNSPGNPRNYFHGKMLPINIDREGDLIYKYVPNEYENRWRK